MHYSCQRSALLNTSLHDDYRHTALLLIVVVVRDVLTSCDAVPSYNSSLCDCAMLPSVSAPIWQVVPIFGTAEAKEKQAESTRSTSTKCTSRAAAHRQPHSTPTQSELNIQHRQSKAPQSAAPLPLMLLLIAKGPFMSPRTGKGANKRGVLVQAVWGFCTAVMYVF